jgi:hypothetical protein
VAFSIAAAAASGIRTASGGGFLAEVQVFIDCRIHRICIEAHLIPRQQISIPGLDPERSTAALKHEYAKGGQMQVRFSHVTCLRNDKQLLCIAKALLSRCCSGAGPRRNTQEIRPIIGWHLGALEIIVNPILDNSYTGFSRLDFAPATRVAGVGLTGSTDHLVLKLILSRDLN